MYRKGHVLNFDNANIGSSLFFRPSSYIYIKSIIPNLDIVDIQSSSSSFSS